MPPLLITLAAILAAYLLGSIPFALVASRVFGLADPRSYGSKNPGATNVLRSGHKGAAIFTLIGDVAKGWLAVFLASRYGPEYGLASATVGLVALAVFFGHLYPVFLAFKGGKGVATALGAFIGIHPLSAGVCFGLWLVITALTRYVSLGSVVGVAAAPLVLYLLAPEHNVELAVGLAPLSLLVVGRHADNIERLRHGTENRFGRKRMAAQPEASGAPAETEGD